jgi:AraC-like DNA-binding protein
LRIALDAGFFDQSHFTTAFRQQFGHAPGTYRRKLANSVIGPFQV